MRFGQALSNVNETKQAEKLNIWFLKGKSFLKSRIGRQETPTKILLFFTFTFDEVDDAVGPACEFDVYLNLFELYFFKWF